MGDGVDKSETVGTGRTQGPPVRPREQRDAATADRHANARVDELGRLLERLTPEVFPELVEYGRTKGREVW